MTMPLLWRPRYELHLLNTRWPRWYKYVSSKTITENPVKPNTSSSAQEDRVPIAPTLWTELSVYPVSSSIFATIAGRSQASELKETSLTSSEKRSCPLHLAPVNLAKENSGWFFASPHVTVMVLLSAGGKLQVSHCVRGNESQDGGFPCVTDMCSDCTVCLG